MNPIAQLLSLPDIVTGLDAGSKKRIFEQAGRLFEGNRGLEHRMVFDALYDRERLGSTGLGLGVAIPHGRIKGLKQPLGAFIRLATGIDFDAPDEQPVQLIFVLLVPEVANEQHLELLSRLAQMFSSRAFRERLATAPDAEHILRCFSEWSDEGG